MLKFNEYSDENSKVYLIDIRIDDLKCDRNFYKLDTDKLFEREIQIFDKLIKLEEDAEEWSSELEEIQSDLEKAQSKMRNSIYNEFLKYLKHIFNQNKFKCDFYEMMLAPADYDTGTIGIVFVDKYKSNLIRITNYYGIDGHRIEEFKNSNSAFSQYETEFEDGSHLV